MDISTSPSSSSSPRVKRPAGRTKFRETRHPVYRGVRHRGTSGRWVCEVRVPGKRGARLWLGTYVTAEAAARANDAAMLALGGSSSAFLNFPDSAWLLAVPSGSSDLVDVRRAAVEAVTDFQRREAANNGPPAATSSVSAATSSDNISSPETSSEPCTDSKLEVPTLADSYLLELDLFVEMELGTYYASLAEGLLIDPPPPATIAGAYIDSEDCCDGGADFALWSY